MALFNLVSRYDKQIGPLLILTEGSNAFRKVKLHQYSLHFVRDAVLLSTRTIVVIPFNCKTLSFKKFRVLIVFKMPQCFVLNCGNYYSKTRNLSKTSNSIIYHVFPSSKRQALLWGSVCRGKDVKEIPPHVRVCSVHFSEKNYQRDLEHELLGLPKRRKLLPDAVPDLFLPKKQVPEKIKTTRRLINKQELAKKKDTVKSINNVPTTINSHCTEEEIDNFQNHQRRKKTVIEHSNKNVVTTYNTTDEPEMNGKRLMLLIQTKTGLNFVPINSSQDQINCVSNANVENIFELSKNGVISGSLNSEQSNQGSLQIEQTKEIENKKSPLTSVICNAVRNTNGTNSESNGLKSKLNKTMLKPSDLLLENSTIKNLSKKQTSVVKENIPKKKMHFDLDGDFNGNENASKKAYKYPTRSSIRIAKKKSMQEEIINKHLLNIKTEEARKNSFENSAYKLKFMNYIDLGLNSKHLARGPTSDQRLNRMLVMEEQEQSIDSPKSSTAENPVQDLEDKSTNNEGKIIQTVTNSLNENDIENKENNENASAIVDVSEVVSEIDDKISENKQNSPESLDIEEVNIQPETESIEDVDSDLKIIDESKSNSNEIIHEELDLEEKNEKDESEVSKRPLEDKCDPFPKKTKISESESDKKSNESGETNKFFTIQDLEQQESKILGDIEYLDQLARKKEREWNNIIHLKKVKEEFLLRLQRKRQVLTISKSDLQSNDFDWESALDLHMKSLNAVNNVPRNRNSCSINSINCSDSGVTILPVPSVRKSIHKPIYDSRLLKNSKASSSERSLLNNSFVKQRSILPKPSTIFTNDCNGVQKTGPKGQPMMDVNLIVERFRQSNPEDIPRRGKRIRSSKTEIDSVSSTSKLLPMISLNNNKVPTSTSVQLIPNKVDLNSELGMLLTSSSDNNRGKDNQNDSSRSSHVSTDSIQEGTSGNISFKDVLVEFARLSQSDRRALKSDYINSNNSKVQDLHSHSASLKSCPEVTLHPVLVNNGNTSAMSNQPASNSLLHGILTKNKPKSSVKPFTNLSPTLARLLTDTTSQPSDVSNINDLLANNQNSSLEAAAKKANDFAIQNAANHLNLGSSSTNINPQYSQTSGAYSLDELETEDSYDRLVIDETHDKSIECDNMSEADATQIPPCQGCKRNSAQFVCAGCTNQWYCSRECQVSDWDQHAEICNG